MAYEPPDPPVVPYLMVHDGPNALDWYVRALGAEVLMRIDEADGRLGHAALSVNGGGVYLADEFPELQGRIGARAPKTLGSTTVSIALAVDDVDACARDRPRRRGDQARRRRVLRPLRQADRSVWPRLVDDRAQGGAP